VEDTIVKGGIPRHSIGRSPHCADPVRGVRLNASPVRPGFPMRPRSLSRRFLAALSSAFLLQLTLLGGGTLCGMRGAQAMGAAVLTESMHDGMQPAAANASMSAASQTPTVTSAPTGSCNTCDATSSCGNPWSPGSCTSMTCCTVAVSARAQVFMDVLSSAPARLVPEPLSAPIGPSFAPEIPPPRA